ncbi:MAG TPA: LysM domain-containing protein [Candidatus Sulfotelmatobacter sp.]|nr:LysM domain-containing protein [Candidatus Sulfotelmatobacter sp.]
MAFGFLSSVWSSLTGTTEQYSSAEILAGSDAFHTYLTGGTNPRIRMWVEETSNLGNQSSTINLLYRLARPRRDDKLTYGYGGIIDVYYEQDETLAKIYQLLPELGGQPNGTVDAATVNLIKWTTRPTTLVALGFTGAADDSKDAQGGLAAMLNVGTFLRLQPYLWKTQLEQIVRQDLAKNISLNDQPALGGLAFGRRLFNVDPSLYAAPDFSRYAGVVPQIVQYLTSDDFLAAHALQAIYSFKDSLIYFNQNGIFATALCCGAGLRWQGLPGKLYKNAQPLVIVNFDLIDSADSVAAVKTIVEGGLTPGETALGASLARNTTLSANVARRRAYFTALGADRFTTLFKPTTVQAVRDAVATITGHKDRVLFIQLGHAPQPLFNHALFKSTIIPVFEGQNTTNAAINMGRAYMQIPRENATVQQRAALYPSVVRQGINAAEQSQLMVTAAGQYNSAPSVWPAKDADAPCTVLAVWNQEYVDEGRDPLAGIHGYFRRLKEQYAQAHQDKFNVALAFMNAKVLTAVERPPALRARASLAAAVADEGGGQEALNALYAKLEPAVVKGQPLDLIPGILTTGVIADYVVALLKTFSPTLTLTVDTFTHEGEPDAITRIELTGVTSAFEKIGVKNTVSVVFTAPDDTMTADLTFTTLGAWIMPGVEWIALRDPFIALRLPDKSFPVTAIMGGYYPALEKGDKPVTARFAIPVASSLPIWPATVEFSQNYPSIALAFQMMTSVNLVSLLPPPLNVIVDFGVVRIETQYDYDAQKLASVIILAKSNTQNLPLVGTITLSDLQMTAMLIDPQGDRSIAVSASGSFKIGSGTVQVSVEYPNWQFNGQLEGTVTIAEMLTAFLPFVTLPIPGDPKIIDFRFSYAKATDSMSVTMKFAMEGGWSFSFPGKANLFTVNEVGFDISRNRGVNQGSITGAIELFGGAAAVGLLLSASYEGETKLWTFRAQQTSGVFDIEQIVKYYLGENFPVPSGLPKVKDLVVSFTSDSGTYEISAATAERWQPISGIDVYAQNVKLKLGYGVPPAVTQDQPVAAARGTLMLPGPAPRAAGTALATDPPPPKKGYYGEFSGDFHLWNIADLSVALVFDPGKYELKVVWGVLTAVVTGGDGQDTIATFTIGERTIGSLVEEFVSWVTGAPYALAAPFNVLNEIPLSNFEVTYNFTKKKVGFNVNLGPIDLGLFTINKIGLVYNPDAAGTKEDPKTKVTVDAAFKWQSSSEALSWDPSKPETTPSPSGGGNKYFDLRLLALGQHVTVAGLTEQRRVQGVIALLRDLKEPEPPEIPVGGTGQPVFAPNSSWFVGMDFGILRVAKDDPDGESPPATPDDYFIQLSIVFNDPLLYALRIVLTGPLAKVFNGLDFQILYRQISETVGVYSAELALPELMRRFQAGAFTITLPTFGIDVYTNGDFQVDIGFPWNQNFARSFTIEAIVPPGIPVVGSAGFYFGKLSSATTNLVPRSSKGWFNPVLVFGFGAQIGLGKSIEAGILRAGFSATVFGIIEGVLARWLPYDGGAPNERKDDLQNGYYFALTGIVGAIGKLYGEVDFAIVKARVDVDIRVMIQIRLASYEPIPITLQASVSISVTISIDLGLFSIDISFSFSATIKATFTLDNPQKNPPWGTDALLAPAANAMPRRLRALAGGAAAVYDPVWTRLQPGTVLDLNGYVAPVLTVAGDEATRPDQQDICYVASFFLTTPPPVQRSTQARRLTGAASGAPSLPRTPGEIAHAALRRAEPRRNARLFGANALGDGAQASFEDFAVRVLQWVLAAGQPADKTVGQVDDLVLTAAQLDAILAYLSDPTQPNPIPVDAIEAFLTAQVSVNLDAPSAQDSGHGVYFPAPPSTRLTVPDYGQWKGVDYVFGSYNTTGAAFRENLAAYFAALRVKVQPPSVDDPLAPELLAAGAPVGQANLSVATYVFADYYTGIARQGVQALLTSLRNFKRLIDPAETVTTIVERVNQAGQLTGEDAFTAAYLFEGNPDHRLTADTKLTIAGMGYRTPGGTSFNDVAKLSMFGNAFDGAALARANADDAHILQPGTNVVAGNASHRIQGGDSLTTIAKALEISLAQLLSTSNVLTDGAVLAPLAVLLIPSFVHAVTDGQTLAAIAGTYGVTEATLAAANGGIAGLFDAHDDPNLNITHLPQYRVGDLLDEMHRTLALQNLGGMMSRFYLNGLRIPTADVTADQPGLFVTQTSPGHYAIPDVMGLFALTGQAFALPTTITLPSKPEDPAFNFTLTRGANETWLTFGTARAPSLTWKLDHPRDYDRYVAVRDYARANVLDLQTHELGPVTVSAVEPSRFPLAQEIVWQTPAVVVLPRQPVALAAQRPRLWTLPPTLVDLPHEALDAPRPRLTPLLSRYDQASGTTVTTPVQNYGTGTLIAFKVKKVPLVASSPTTEHTYEIIGAATDDIVLLERLLDQLRSSDGSFQQMLLLYPPSAAGSVQTGWQSGDPAVTLVGITQVNLSTETRPPTSLAAARADARITGALGNVINGPTAFLRLLWEASITRQGGFFLAYHDSRHDTGLPDSIFNDRGEANVAVLALYNAVGAAGQPFTNYVNVVATDEGFTLGDAAFVLETVRDPYRPPATTTGDTLAGMAARAYLDPATLIESNPDVTFRNGTTVVVEGGLYQVRPAATPSVQDPGGDVALIAQHFGTTVDELKRANPYRTDWPVAPNVLPPFVALALPRIPRSIATDGVRFSDLAAYYGISVAALAATHANAELAGLLAAGQTLPVTLGPVERSASVPPGVAGVQLVRTAPGTITPTDGATYLRHMFSLLGYQVAGLPEFANPDFHPSTMGLPAGPVDPDAAPGTDKIQAPRLVAELTDWTYRLTLPFPQLWAHPYDPADPSPYRGVGGMLQVGLDWRDIFGNLALTDLGNPRAAHLNYPPQITGYTDDIVGLTQWPAMTAAYRLRPDDQQNPLLDLVLDFDPSAYLKDTTVSDDAPRRRRIRQAIQIYDTVLQQLRDQNGVALELTTTVTPDAGSVLSPAAADALVGWIESIRTWLNSLLGSAPTTLQQVYTITVPLALDHVNAGQIFAVRAEFTIRRKAALVAGALRSAAAVGARSVTVAPYTGPLSTMDAGTAQTKAWLQAARGTFDQGTQSLRDLGLFAAAFTAALTKLGARSFRIATGGDRTQTATGSAATIWAVQLGTDASTAISYRIDDASDPIVYAPQPLSNKLASGQAVAIYEYKTGKGIDFTTPSRLASFDGVDLDMWMQQSLAYIDGLLSPQYITPMLVIQARTGSDLRTALLAAKRALAEALRLKMIAVYRGQATTDEQLAAIREVFLQRMLDTLGSFYTTKAGLQFEASVEASIAPDALDEQPPRLFGQVAMLAPTGAPNAGLDKNVSITSPKLDLAFADTGTATARKRLLSTLFSSTTVESKNVTVNLEYQGRFIEHQIGTLAGITGYQPSSWLTFVDDQGVGGSWPLTQPLGQFAVPIVLRQFPATPTLIVQAALPPTATLPPDGGLCNPLRDVKTWTYGFTYSQAVHQQQDTVYGTILFNVKVNGLTALFAPPRTLFEDLAEFVNVYPNVLVDLNSRLATLTFATDDATQIADASVAVSSATALIARLAETAAAAPLVRGALRGPAMPSIPPFEFVITEGEVSDTNPALMVTITATTWPAAGVGAPFVDIEPDKYERQPAPSAGPPPPDNVFRYVYKIRGTSDYLSAGDGARISERLFRLPNLDVLQRQDAETSLYLTRNEELVDGHPSADPFVYTTPTVRFPDPLLPTLTNELAIDVSTILGTTTCDPVNRTLTEHLTALYAALFVNAGVPDSTIQFVAQYEHSLNAAMLPVSVPVCMMPPVQVAVADGGAGKPLADVVAQQAAAMQAWFDAHQPSVTRASYRFDLTLMSDLTQQPMPILNLTGLYLPVSTITSGPRKEAAMVR